MDANRAQLVPIVDDIGLGESSRWHHDRVWYCDWVDGAVISVTPDGGHRIVHAQLDGFPVCIDWDADGRLLVVDGSQRQVLRDGALGLELVADLAAVSDAPWNEVATHPSGRVYVNGVGFDMIAGDAPTTGQIAVIDTDGSVREVADDLAFPNGMAIVAARSQLVVAESHAGRITSFTITPDGDLTDRATLADMPGSAPDGLCVAGDGTIWYADVPNRHCRRIGLDGTVIETITGDRGCFSCTLSPDGHLYITAGVWDAHTFTTRRGVLYRTRQTDTPTSPRPMTDERGAT
jgi:sugar lactone lactonase YvrE